MEKIYSKKTLFELFLRKMQLSIFPVLMCFSGIFILLVGQEYIPDYNKLIRVSGIVSKLDIYKGVRFSIRGVNKNFDYSVNAPRSSLLNDSLKLSEQENLPITILYDNHSFKVPATGSIRYSVWQIESGSKIIMSFDEVSSSIAFWNRFGFWAGIAFLFSGIALEFFVLNAASRDKKL